MNNKLKNLNLGEFTLFLSHFFREVKLLEPLSSLAHTNLSHRVELDKKDYVLKIYSGSDRRRIIQDILLQNFFNDQGLPCQRIIALGDNHLLECKGFYCSLSEFIYGEPMGIIDLKDAFQIFDVLKRLYEIGENYTGDIANKSVITPPAEDGPYIAEFEEMLNRYKSICGSFGRMETLIHGDFHFGHALRSQEGKIFLLDFESVRMGDSLEDLASFIFYSKCTGRNQMLSPRELFDYFIGENNAQSRDVKTLKYYVRKVSLMYGLGSIWEFNRGFIDQKELGKRLKTINRADNLEI